MAKKKKLHFIVCVCIGIAFFAYLYTNLVYMRTPNYILGHTATSYQIDAKEFYYQNSDALSQLMHLTKKFQEGKSYYYAFHAHEFDSPDIPSDVKNVLQAVEKRTESQYTFTITRDFLEICIADKTNLMVFLANGDTPHSGAVEIKPEWGTVESLNGEWSIISLYILRG